MTKCLNIQLTAEHFGFFTNFFFHYFIYLKVFLKKKKKKKARSILLYASLLGNIKIHAVKLEGYIFFTWKNSNSIYSRKSEICSYSISSRRIHQIIYL